MSSAWASAAQALRSPVGAYGVLSFAFFTGMGLFNPYVGLWLQALGFGSVAIGAVASLQSWTRVIGPYGWAWLGDHTGQRVRIMRFAAAGCALVSLGLSQTSDWSLMFTLMGVLFLANSAVGPLHEAALAQLLTTNGQMDLVRYGRVRLWGSVGFIASVATFGLLFDVLGIAQFVWAVLAANVLLLWACWRLPADRAAIRITEKAPSVAPLLRQPRVRWFFASVALTVLAHVAMYAFFSLYLESLGFSKRTVGLLWSLGVVVEVAYFWFQGRWSHRVAPGQWLQWAALTTTLRFGLIAAAAWVPWLIWLAQPLHAITFAAHHNACMATVTELFPDRRRSRGQALYSVLGYGLPGVVGGLAGGYIVQVGGYQALFAGSAGVALLAWWCARQMVRSPAPSPLG